MTEHNFDAALDASRRVAETLKSLRQQLDKNNLDIRQREEELKQHQAAPLPESDLINFFREYVGMQAHKGKQALHGRLSGMLYPDRFGQPLRIDQLPALSFEGIEEIVDPAIDNWLTDHLPFVLPNTAAGGEGHLTTAILTFILQEQINKALAELLETQPVTYRRAEAIGLPLADRRERVATLHSELASLAAKKAEIEGQIANLKRGVA